MNRFTAVKFLSAIILSETYQQAKLIVVSQNNCFYEQPAAVEELRRWTSSEALGEITVAPDCTTRIVSTDGELSDGTMASDDEGIDHKLPSPEEQLHVVALK